ncbi:MAG: pyruvate kinase [Actinobacteria bacterium]|nr:pyruvate kinase [Actinomycetota bacterium]
MTGRSKTKIIATLGPSVRDPAVLEKMVRAGMDVARINASHASHALISEEVAALRGAARRAGREVGVVLDLMGPKLRVGVLPGGGIDLSPGQEVVLSASLQPGCSASCIPVEEEGLTGALGSGDEVLLDDGALRLRVLEASPVGARCRVEVGGRLRSRKGISAPGVELGLPALTEKDLRDLEVGLSLGIDWVALSFVGSAADIALLREELGKRGSSLPVIAKIERRAAVERTEEIIAEADAVMVARGDLGVEMALEEVPLLQKGIVESAASCGKPVIIATQMLQSMIDHPSPTRAEVSDVANAVLEGADAVMLSGETAVGAYPVEAVSTMRRIVLNAETALPYERWLEERRRWIHRGKVEAVAYAACELALRLDAKAIVTPTDSGFTALQVSRFRPGQPILAPTPHERTARRMTLYWGVLPRLEGMAGGADRMFIAAEEAARAEGLAEAGDVVVITAGVKRPGEEGMPVTNTIHCTVCGSSC